MHNYPTCGVSRYKVKSDECSDDASIYNDCPSKVCWYLPVIARFKQLFANVEDAKNLTWHANGRIKDGLLRHPVDSPQWKTIDQLYPEFGQDPTNLRVGLASDGMNPFGNLSCNHSLWPILLIIYNLPPWLCIKWKYIMMRMMIVGPRQPGNDIDVYLAPLIEDLRKLWVEGVDVCNGNAQETFKLCAMIFCTINGFPTYGNLSGYSVKGHHVCPICEKDTSYIQLKHGKKTVYTRHRRFLKTFHPYRRMKKAFNRTSKIDNASNPLLGHQAFDRLKNIIPMYGKTQKKDGSHNNIWKKKSIFFDLPYRCDLHVRHFLDVMHVEKNVCDSLVGTLLNIKGKTKDGLKCHQDLVEMGIRQQLHPVPKAIWGILPDKVRVAITRLCFFFNVICSKVIDLKQLDDLENEASIIICQLEMYFPPAFFDIMIHLVVHLVREIWLCGPIYLWWMYPVERYMKVLKSYTKNQYRPEASIVERYIAKEVIEFCSEYIDNASPFGLPESRHESTWQGRGTRGFNVVTMDR
ncbi:uncharacterized protein [Glycine max]|uniref:uncharacterized protein n=1 Tax=Glycine max TaxID=3847 RepID=UPI0003DEA867|nr:uncharacterized protein LOC100796469 [Glycine max]|eukprot:XP_006601656.1 uncharacterized protein LOC100796469 [Glycine max]